ncbi:MAG: helix-turn-helix domain-containing protein [Erysipelotrichaceae bacterium]|nr:helix-turn-helix domain-containing protein [Erysipelotrichaceae bacterium]
MLLLKQLRKFKGLTQSECAKLVGVPLRTYQNYENDKDKIYTFKYNEILKKLINYGRPLEEHLFLSDYRLKYSTEVATGNDLIRLINNVKDFKKRECYSSLEHFINNDYRGNVCVLYGLRRTGKTTLLLQLASSLPIDEVAYINIKKTDSMGLLRGDIERLRKEGIKYLLIDEITLLEDFINVSSILPNICSMLGLKIILSGTDSLGFKLAERNELYDRAIFVHTTYISFKEFSYLLDNNSIDDYIEFGGTLLKENMTFEQYQIKKKEFVFSNEKSTKLYIDSAIAENIQNSLLNDTYGSRYSRLKQLYNEDELTNVINRIIEDMNHEFALKVIQRKFKSHDLGSAKEIITKHDDRFFDILDRINTNKLLEKLKDIISVKEKDETRVEVKYHHINEIKKYLLELDLIFKTDVVFEDRNREEYIIFTQPGMRYSIVKALVNSLLKDAYFETLEAKDKNYIIKKILEDVKGRMIEDIVMLELSKKNKEYHMETFKFIASEGEIDCIFLDRDKLQIDLYEVKYSKTIDKNQCRHLENKRIIDLLKYRYGKIKSKNIIYRGKTTKVGDINYINIEEFLKR